MSRLPDWEARLGAFIETNRHREFAWGEWDCILFACAAVEAMTGEDPAATYRGRYSDATGARAALRELGKGTLLKTVDAEFQRKKVGYAGRGDLIWRDGAVGVCMGGAALFVGEARLARTEGVARQAAYISVPRPLWQKAWAV